MLIGVFRVGMKQGKNSCIKLEQVLVLAPKELRVPGQLPDLGVCHWGRGVLHSGRGPGLWRMVSGLGK